MMEKKRKTTVMEKKRKSTVMGENEPVKEF